jgi:C-terminal processing protease CtpA/Prc
MASADARRIHDVNKAFARHVWATIGLSFYDKSGGGVLGGRGGHDPGWERVWAAANRLGEGGAGGGRGFDSVEGTREVIRYMVRELKDEYSAYLAPREMRGLSRWSPRSSYRLDRTPSPTASPTGTSGPRRAQTIRSSKEDKADGTSSLTASVGMQLEPAIYCPPATTLLPQYDARTDEYAYPSLPPSPFPLGSPHPYARPCAVVAGVLPNSPAEEAGIRIGDRLSRIGHVRTENAGWDRDGALENTLLQGREGTSVQVEVLRSLEEGGREGGRGGQGRREVRVPLTLRRRSFAAHKYPALRVQSLLDAEGRRISYIRLHRFDAQATDQLRSVLFAEERVGAAGYVIDLRNNMGGVFQEGLKMATLFLPDPKAVLCFTMDAWGGYSPHLAEEYDTSTALPVTGSARGGAHPGLGLLGASGKEWRPLVARTKPVAVLVNKGSASSSETFAAALHDNGRAWLVGERTFGKSLIQHLFSLPDGGVLKLTVAEYLTPHQRHLARVRLPGPTRGRSVSATTFNAGEWRAGRREGGGEM